MPQPTSRPPNGGDPLTSSVALAPDTEVDPSVGVAVLIEEYKSAKAEQVHRISVRDGLIYAVIVVVAAVIGGADRLGNHAALLVLPLVCLVLGWTYLTNDVKVSAIGRYLREDLAARLSRLSGEDLLRWETAHRSDARRRERKTIQLGVDLTVFCLPGAAALVAFWCARPVHPALIAVSVAEALGVLIAGWQITVYADLTHHRDQTSDL